MPNGSKYWRFKYRFGGKEKLQSFGVYPEVSLIEARSKRDEARKLLATDIDPTSVKRERKLKARLEAGTTFELVAREWHELNKERWTPRHGEEILYRMERDVFPQLGRMPIAQIKPLQLLQVLRRIEDRGAHELTRRALQYCGSVFRYVNQQLLFVHDLPVIQGYRTPYYDKQMGSFRLQGRHLARFFDPDPQHLS